MDWIKSEKWKQWGEREFLFGAVTLARPWLFWLPWSMAIPPTVIVHVYRSVAIVEMFEVPMKTWVANKTLWRHKSGGKLAEKWRPPILYFKYFTATKKSYFLSLSKCFLTLCAKGMRFLARISLILEEKAVAFVFWSTPTNMLLV